MSGLVRAELAEAWDEPVVGPDGAATLLLACAVAAGTLGASLAVSLWHVLRVALGSRIAPTGRHGRVLVLGVRLADGLPCATYRARLDRAFALAQRDPSLSVVVLGGRATPTAPAEAEIGRCYLTLAGLEPGRIATEGHSRHTLENLRNYRAMFPPGNAPDILVTSRFHLARAMLMARGLGLAHAVCAAEDRLPLSPRALARLLVEAALLHWYVVGRGFARLTGNRRMLAQIS